MLFPRVAANLVPEAGLIEPACFDGRPPIVTHQLCQPAACRRVPVTLWSFEEVEHRLGADPLDAVVEYFAAHALQADAPRIGMSRYSVGLGFIQLLGERQH